jgi:phage terminase Nu1 subunit (DNA packaging protein)
MANRADQYWQLAQDCFKLAAMVPAGEARKTLLDLAREWQRLADEQQRATDLRKKE